MLELLARNWWVILLRGLFAIAFGIMAFVWPGLTLAALIILFAVYAIVDGVLAIIAGVTGAAPNGRWYTFVLWGLLGVLVGIATILYPGLTALTLLYLIAIWAIVRGVMEIVAAVQLRKVLDNEWILVLAGALSILFGVLLIARPGAGALTVLWLIGAASIAVGILLVILSFRFKALKGRIDIARDRLRTA
jgi:uncharacterized membrane protein HdeD (DUF308 family)